MWLMLRIESKLIILFRCLVLRNFYIYIYNIWFITNGDQYKLLNHLILAWGTLSTQGIVILSGVVVVVRRSFVVRSFVGVTKSCHQPKFENRRRYWPTFFLIDSYERGGVQSEIFFVKRCEEKVWNR